MAREGTEAVIVFYTDAAEVQREDTTAYEAVSWVIRRPWADGLEVRIAANIETWLAQAQTEAYDVAAAEVRTARNKLLADTDAEMCMDRMDFNIPDNITAASLLVAVKGFFEVISAATTGDMAEYRQSLRDITTQTGFPYDVAWPVKPG